MARRKTYKGKKAKKKIKKLTFSGKIRLLFAFVTSMLVMLIGAYSFNTEFQWVISAPENLQTSLFETNIHFIDVGQADATLIEQSGDFCLIDTGTGDAEELINYLKSVNVNEIDLLILTHHHADHIGGAVDIMQSFDIGEIWVFDYEKAGRPDNYTVLRTLEYIDTQALYNKTPQVGEVFALGDGEIEVLHNGLHDENNANNTSITTMFTIGEIEFLSCGDAEQEQIDDMLANGADVSAQIYKAAHHGSSSSNSMQFLQLIMPEYVLISCAIDNSYGHPHEESLQSFESVNAAVYGTNVNGNIVMGITGDEISILPEREYDLSA